MSYSLTDRLEVLPARSLLEIASRSTDMRVVQCIVQEYYIRCLEAMHEVPAVTQYLDGQTVEVATPWET